MSDDIQTTLAEAQKALAQSNPAIAAKLLSDILKLDASHRDANYYLAIIHRQAGQPEQALTHLSEILRIDPRDATASQEKGFSEMAINQPSEALVSFRRAVTSMIHCSPVGGRLRPSERSWTSPAFDQRPNTRSTDYRHYQSLCSNLGL